MKIFGFLRVFHLMAVLAVMLLMGSLSGCGQQETTPVGGVLDYDPTEDPAMQASEEYMEKEAAQSGTRP